MLRILHTSDWHIGRLLYGRKRYEEHAAFLNWLVARLDEHQVDVLLVAGDIFDTMAPTNYAQELYYRFLHRAAATGCRHIVVTGGNHDSPSFLDAPKPLLAALQIHVIGEMTNPPEDEVLLLRDDQGLPELVVCAVPFLRERDVRLSEEGESVTDKALKLEEGISAHYRRVGQRAQAVQEMAACEGRRVPIVGMGHLFAAGGAVQEEDGVRELHIGSLAQVPANAFPACFDYVALGHLHVPQQVGGSIHVRYSGSPLPMGFGEAKQQKQVLLVTFGEPEIPAVSEGGLPAGEVAVGNWWPGIASVPIPRFQSLARISGDMASLEAAILTLKTTDPTAWLEVTHTGDAVIGDLREQVEGMVAGSGLSLLRIQDEKLIVRATAPLQQTETLDDLSHEDVFERCLETFEVPEPQREVLRQAYQEIVLSMDMADVHAE
jgi:exonuclease SbcD